MYLLQTLVKPYCNHFEHNLFSFHWLVTFDLFNTFSGFYNDWFCFTFSANLYLFHRN